VLAAALTIALAITPTAPGALELAWPLRCTAGVDCWIAHHVDHAVGPGLRDHACGTLTYNGHDGVDVAIPDLAAMARGVEVLAAADGVVRATRDGEPDRPVEQRGREAVAGRECGNGVLLDHGAGWQTQYCHLRVGSIAVAPGMRVTSGTVLGRVGLSGLSSFPHLHLEVRRDGREVDPFTGGPVGAATCGTAGGGLWRAETAAGLPSVAIPLTGLGVASREPERAELDRGEHRSATLPLGAPALVVWARGFGLRRGDRWHLQLLAPDGRAIVDQSLEQDRDQALAIRWAGRRRPADGWAPGTWRARVEVRRGAERFVLERRLELSPE
jgi:murein DD-endopeptidase MepM/ murein hydrolase activator NlpD